MFSTFRLESLVNIDGFSSVVQNEYTKGVDRMIHTPTYSLMKPDDHGLTACIEQRLSSGEPKQWHQIQTWNLDQGYCNLFALPLVPTLAIRYQPIDLPDQFLSAAENRSCQL